MAYLLQYNLGNNSQTFQVYIKNYHIKCQLPRQNRAYLSLQFTQDLAKGIYIFIGFIEFTEFLFSVPYYMC